MLKQKVRFFVLIALTCAGMTFMFYSPSAQPARAQQPTGSVPTVTGTPSGAIVALFLDEARPQELVYSGPSSYLYPKIGIVLAGQELPAYGFSEDENWIQIYYPGVPGSVAWIYAPYVKFVKNGSMPVLPAPPTPTPAITAIVNIDPTLLAAFITPVVPTRLPTFTPPAPLIVAAFTDSETNPNRIPAGLLILGFGVIGGFGVLISFLRGR